uniref:Uncharacterized protein n=1 Tax=Anopheles funestus TaxID=62324 RepID=A0A182RMC7_ANOFN
MRIWFVVFALFLIGVVTNKADDSRTELIACSSTLFQLAAHRLSIQLGEFMECKRKDTDSSDKNCRDIIQRATDDLQQGLNEYNNCTKFI